MRPGSDTHKSKQDSATLEILSFPVIDLPANDLCRVAANHAQRYHEEMSALEMSALEISTLAKSYRALYHAASVRYIATAPSVQRLSI